MKKMAMAASLLVVCGMSALALGVTDEEKTPTIKQVMKKANAGPNSLLAEVGKGLKPDEPDWDDVQKQTKEMATLAAALAKNDPPQGEKESWEKLAKQYHESAKALNEAAQKKDKKEAVALRKKISGSCAACHKAHKPKS
jgi:cytochrome c556